MSIKNIIGFDIGNTNIHWAKLTENNIENSFTVNNNDLLAIPWESFNSEPPIAIIASVNPKVEKLLSGQLEKHKIKSVTLNLKNQNIIKSTYETLGIDRVCDLAAGLEHFKNTDSPIIVFNFGTCTTISCCDSRGNFLGGVIKAGIRLELQSMFKYTELLPNVDIQENFTPDILSKETYSAILSGVLLGQISIVKNYINLFTNSIGSTPKIIFTGGHSKLISSQYKGYDLLDKDLSLRGISSCYKNLVMAN